MFFISVYSSSFSALYGRRSLAVHGTNYTRAERHIHTQSKRVIYYTHTHTETDSAGPAIISWVITYGENETSFPFSLVDSGWPFVACFLPSFLPRVRVCVYRCTTYLVSGQVLVLVSSRLYGHPHSFATFPLYTLSFCLSKYDPEIRRQMACEDDRQKKFFKYFFFFC
jgi:hypothetical protein